MVELLIGGYGEIPIKMLTKTTANVTANTYGLKTATETGRWFIYFFSASK